MNLDSRLISILKNADQVLALTGSGVSAESGIPTFREAQSGLWSKYDPQELATPQAFLNNPDLVLSWYHWRIQLIDNAIPNLAHKTLTDFENLFPDFILATQNVDGLHQEAGSNNVLELHCSISRARCWQSGHRFDSWEYQNGVLPTCPICQSLLRPDVVWFGESLPDIELSAAFSAARKSQLFLCIGTSALVQPAASLPFAAKDSGAYIVEINVEPTPLTTYSDFFLQGSAVEILPQLKTELLG